MVLLHKSENFGDGAGREFHGRSVADQGGKTGRVERNAKGDSVAKIDEDLGRPTIAAGGGKQGEAAPEERMRWIDHFDPVGGVKFFRVVEQGIKNGVRSTTFPIPS